MSLTWQPSRWTRVQLEERRLYAQPLIEEDQLNATQIAEHTGVSPSTVRAWKRRLRLRGSLEATRASGPPRRLSDVQIAEVMDLLRAGPDPIRYPDQRWTCPRVREVIGLRFDVWYDVDHVSRLLHTWGFSSQKPEKRAIERQEAAIETWVNVRVPELEKKIEAGETLVFADEVGFSLKPTVTRTWAPCGQTPILKAKTSWQKLSTIGAITTNGQLLQHTHPNAIRGPQVIAFVQHVLYHVPGQITLLFDNASIHKTKALSAFVAQEARLTIEYFPAYAPELNPIELIWAYVKQHLLGNFCPQNLIQLKARLTQAWQRLRYLQLPNRLLNGPQMLPN